MRFWLVYAAIGAGNEEDAAAASEETAPVAMVEKMAAALDSAVNVFLLDMFLLSAFLLMLTY